MNFIINFLIFFLILGIVLNDEINKNNSDIVFNLAPISVKEQNNLVLDKIFNFLKGNKNHKFVSSINFSEFQKWYNLLSYEAKNNMKGWIKQGNFELVYNNNLESTVLDEFTNEQNLIDEFMLKEFKIKPFGMILKGKEADGQISYKGEYNISNLKYVIANDNYLKDRSIKFLPIITNSDYFPISCEDVQNNYSKLFDKISKILKNNSTGDVTLNITNQKINYLVLYICEDLNLIDSVMKNLKKMFPSDKFQISSILDYVYYTENLKFHNKSSIALNNNIISFQSEIKFSPYLLSLSKEYKTYFNTLSHLLLEFNREFSFNKEILSNREKVIQCNKANSDSENTKCESLFKSSNELLKSELNKNIINLFSSKNQLIQLNNSSAIDSNVCSYSYSNFGCNQKFNQADDYFIFIINPKLEGQFNFTVNVEGITNIAIYNDQFSEIPSKIKCDITMNCNLYFSLLLKQETMFISIVLKRTMESREVLEVDQSFISSSQKFNPIFLHIHSHSIKKELLDNPLQLSKALSEINNEIDSKHFIEYDKECLDVEIMLTNYSDEDDYANTYQYAFLLKVSNKSTSSSNCDIKFKKCGNFNYEISNKIIPSKNPIFNFEINHLLSDYFLQKDKFKNKFLINVNETRLFKLKIKK